MVNTNFLKRFSQHEWVDLQAGRLGVLRLQGQNGALDIFATHCDPHEARARQATLQTFASSTNLKTQCLTILCGDFNFVEHNGDRICKDSGIPSGHSNQAEADTFREAVLAPIGFHELEQEHFTYEGGRAFSRIDRVYSNMHTFNQLDCTMFCDALPWCKGLSDHRPIRFGRQTRSSKKNFLFKKLPDWTLENENWSGWVWEELTKLEGRHDNEDAFRTLKHLKQAMYAASRKVKQAQQTQIATTLGAQLSVTMGLLRAAEIKNIKWAIQCCSTYPFLAGVIDPHDPALSVHPNIEQIREHAVELATKKALYKTKTHSTVPAPSQNTSTANIRRISKSN